MSSKSVNENVLAIRAVFKTKNRFKYSNKMFNLLKFEVVSTETIQKKKECIKIKTKNEQFQVFYQS